MVLHDNVIAVLRPCPVAAERGEDINERLARLGLPVPRKLLRDRSQEVLQIGVVGLQYPPRRFKDERTLATG